MGLERAKNLSAIAAVRQAHMRVINTLIDAMCDHCLSTVWRKQCYRYIKRLLPLLYEILTPQEYDNKTKEIKTLHSYCFKDGQNKHPQPNTEYYRVPSIKK